PESAPATPFSGTSIIVHLGHAAMFMQTETHFKSVLNTNYAASAAETAQIREFLIQPLEELARLNTEISRLKSTLTYLLSQRERLQIFVNSHKALISPVRRLPGEAPLLLTLKYEQPFSQLLERRSSGMKTWQGQSMYKSILDTFFEFRERWGNVMLRVPSAVLTSIEEMVKPEEVPLLKTLVVDYDIASRQLLIDGSHDGTQLEERALPLGDFICHAPALQELTLLDPIQNIYAMPMDWSKLTHFKSETPSSDNIT
ncbi:hypothetical protein MPER_04491, partial [Moniliophthora perniciosa FA553]